LRERATSLVYLVELGSDGFVSSERPGFRPRRFRDAIVPVSSSLWIGE
jgi:hypothetical protein